LIKANLEIISAPLIREVTYKLVEIYNAKPYLLRQSGPEMGNYIEIYKNKTIKFQCFDDRAIECQKFAKYQF